MEQQQRRPQRTEEQEQSFWIKGRENVVIQCYGFVCLEGGEVPAWWTVGNRNRCLRRNWYHLHPQWYFYMKSFRVIAIVSSYLERWTCNWKIEAWLAIISISNPMIDSTDPFFYFKNKIFLSNYQGLLRNAILFDFNFWWY